MEHTVGPEEKNTAKRADVSKPPISAAKSGFPNRVFYRWKKVYGGLQPREARELKQLRDENTKLKRLVADLSLDKVMLQDIVQKKF